MFPRSWKPSGTLEHKKRRRYADVPFPRATKEIGDVCTQASRIRACQIPQPVKVDHTTGVYDPYFFWNSDVGSFTSHKKKSVEVLWDGTYGFSSLSEKTMSLVVRQGIEPATSCSANRRSPNWANQSVVDLQVKIIYPVHDNRHCTRNNNSILYSSEWCTWLINRLNITRSALIVVASYRRPFWCNVPISRTRPRSTRFNVRVHNQLILCWTSWLWHFDNSCS